MRSTPWIPALVERMRSTASAGMTMPEVTSPLRATPYAGAPSPFASNEDMRRAKAAGSGSGSFSRMRA